MGYPKDERTYRGGNPGHYQKGEVGERLGGHLPGVRVHFGECPSSSFPGFPSLGQPEPRAGQDRTPTLRSLPLHGGPSLPPWSSWTDVVFPRTLQQGAAELLAERSQALSFTQKVTGWWTSLSRRQAFAEDRIPERPHSVGRALPRTNKERPRSGPASCGSLHFLKGRKSYWGSK